MHLRLQQLLVTEQTVDDEHLLPPEGEHPNVAVPAEGVDEVVVGGAVGEQADGRLFAA